MIAQLSGFEVMRLVRELKPLEGAFLQKIYEPWEGLFLLRFNTKAGKKALVHKAGDWLYLADETDVNLDLTSDQDTTDVPAFIRVLRDHLTNAFVIGARQLAFDRIVEIEFRRDVPYFLVFEMFGDGNIIMRREGIIIGALRTMARRSRVIMGGKEYKPPPLRKDPRVIELDELAVLVKESTADIVRTLATSINLGGTYAEEVCQRTGLDKSLKAKDLTIEQIRSIREVMRAITTEVSDGTGGYVHSLDGKRAAISAVRLQKFGDGPVEPFADLGQAIRTCYPLVEEQEADAKAMGTGPTHELDAHIERLSRQQKQQEEALVRFQGEMDDAAAKSEAIYINYKTVEEAIEKVRAARDEKGWKEVLNAFPELEVDPSQSTIKLELPTQDATAKPLKVELDIRKDVNDNARAYYESIKVMRDKLKGAEDALVRTRIERNRLVEKRTKAEGADDGVAKKRVRRKRFWFESYRWFVSANGNIVLGGKDASSNRRLVKRHLSEGDRYIHADIHGAPSIVVKATDPNGAPLDIPESTLEEACHYAVCFSKAWSGMLGSGEAYWVKPEQVSTTAQSGEFVPKGGFMIRGTRNYFRNLDMRLAIGFVKIENVEVVMCAPIESLKPRTDRFHVLVPSRSKKTDVSRAIAKELGVPVEDVEAVLPPGGMELVKE